MAYTVNEIMELSYDKRFRVMLNGLENAREQEVAQHISIFGFVPQRIGHGINLVNNAKDLNSRQQIEYGKQFSATASLHKKKAEAEKRVGITWKIAKMVIQDRGIRRALGIHRDRVYHKNGWIAQMDHFYHNITHEVIVILTEYGYSAEKIAEEYQMVQEVIAAEKKQDEIMAKAQRTTFERDSAIDELHLWMRKFYRISKMALADQPQLIEKLGLIDRR